MDENNNERSSGIICPKILCWKQNVIMKSLFASFHQGAYCPNTENSNNNTHKNYINKTANIL